MAQDLDWLLPMDPGVYDEPQASAPITPDLGRDSLPDRPPIRAGRGDDRSSDPRAHDKHMGDDGADQSPVNGDSAQKGRWLMVDPCGTVRITLG